MQPKCWQLQQELATAEANLVKWKVSEHPTIVAECEKRVIDAKIALFKCQGYINLGGSNAS